MTKPINYKFFLISIYILLISVSIFRMFQEKTNNISLHVEMIIALIALVIYIFLSQMRVRKETASAQVELDILSERIPCGVAKIIVDDSLTLCYGNIAYYHIHGYTPDELVKILENKTVLLIHPADVVSTMAELKKQSQYGQSINIDFRVVHKTGKNRWIHLEAFLDHRENDYPIYQCIYTDITDFQASIQQVQMEMERYRIISDISDDILFDYDINTKTVTASQTFVKQYGLNPIITNFREILLDENYIHYLDKEIFIQLCDHMDAGCQEIFAELRFRISQNRFIWYRIQGTALMDKRGQPIKIIGKAVNIDVQKSETEELTKKSQIDPLTGIYNKIVTGEKIDDHLSNDGKNSIHALLIIDIDNFKGINDNLGHVIGDEVLINISRELKEVLRSTDIIGRIGGDEFIILLKNVDTKDSTIHKAEDICRIFRNAYTGDNKNYKISGSIGIALFPSDGKSYAELYKNADQALYVAKDGGKDRFEFFSGENHVIKPLEKIRKDTHAFGDVSRISLDELLLHKIYSLLEQNELNPKIINQILGFIGDNYEINRACILEFSERNGQVSNLFSWHNEGTGTDASNYYNLSLESWSNYINCFDKEGVFCCSASLLKKRGAKGQGCNCDAVSSLQSCVVSKEQFKVLIILEDCHQDRKWTKDQKETLAFIAKILGYYFMHLQTQKTLIEGASIDILTGVRSFEAFHTEAEELIQTYSDKKYALINSDIQRFKDINDSIGHNNGDKVIIYFASSIQKKLKPCELVGRVSADVFTILVQYENIEELTARIMEWNNHFHTCVHPLNIPNEIYIAAGVYSIQPGELDIPAMFDKANAARKISKKTRQNSVCYYDEELHQKLIFQKEIEDNMNSSLENGDFLVYIQPKYTLSNREVSGGEALIRWKHPTRGFIFPCDFIPIFEKNLFILDIDFYVLDIVCTMIQDWQTHNKPIVPISVNFSRVHLAIPDFVSKLVKTIEMHNVSPELIEIELTESAFLHGDTNILKVAEELKLRGFTISMDDFGSGYSSLNALKDLPIDVLKLDKDFFKNDIPTDKEKIIIEGFVKMAKELQMKVVSEGVEYEWQAEFLNSIHCELAQGYLFSHPIEIEQFEKMLYCQANLKNVYIEKGNC